MLDVIRSFVYGWGFRPRASSIFFSQPRALTSAYLDAIKQVKFTGNAASSEIAAIVDQMEREMMVPDSEDVRAMLYRQMTHCIVCGSFLALLVVDVKECPQLHGKYYMSEDNKGMPVIIFEPTERTKN